MSTKTKNITCPCCASPLTKKEIVFWKNCDYGVEYLADNDAECFSCQAADTFWENATLDYAESGGGSEMLNDIRSETL